MRILLDECRAAREAGFGGKKNGELLNAAEQAGFEILITFDQNLPYQQNVQRRKLSLIVIRADSNKLKDLLPHVPACIKGIRRVRTGQVLRVGL